MVIKSSMRLQGTNRLCFQPYDHNEIAFIIEDRLKGSAAVQKEAVELASRKVNIFGFDIVVKFYISW